MYMYRYSPVLLYCICIDVDMYTLFSISAYVLCYMCRVMVRKKPCTQLPFIMYGFNVYLAFMANFPTAL